LPRLEQLGRELFDAHAEEPEVLTIWWPRFRRIAAWFIERELECRAEVQRIAAELEGELLVGGGEAAVRLRARADRIEIGRDGTLRILDYKTGRLPEVGHVARGLAPQLALEAMIAAGGGFAAIPATEDVDLLYWQLAGGEPAGVERAAGGRKADAAALLARARTGVERLLRHFANPATAYIAVPRPEIAPVFDDYEHLARIAEWRGWGGR
jgi:ATP-dependent helicase/nuclease subunit B